jgi:hypothetical protein
MENILSIINGVQEKMERFVNNDMMRVCASELGLDERCGYVYVNEDCIIVEQCFAQRLDYYGGFEYVDKDSKSRIGDFVVYMDEDDRVARAIEHFVELKEEQEQS